MPLEVCKHLSGFEKNVQVNIVCESCGSGAWVDAIKSSNRKCRYAAAACPSEKESYSMTPVPAEDSETAALQTHTYCLLLDLRPRARKVSPGVFNTTRNSLETKREKPGLSQEPPRLSSTRTWIQLHCWITSSFEIGQALQIPPWLPDRSTGPKLVKSFSKPSTRPQLFPKLRSHRRLKTSSPVRQAFATSTVDIHPLFASITNYA